MAIATAQPQTSHDEWRTRRWAVTGRVVVLLSLAAVMAILLVGERRSDLGSLHGGLADGSVTEVRITGMPEGGVQDGFATVRLGWESRFFNRYTEILVVSSERMTERPTSSEDLPVVVGDPVVTLEYLQPDVVILRGEYRAGTFMEAGDWTLRGWPSSAVGLLLLATLFMLMAGPQPWRATRWAWFWFIVASPPFGVLTYVLLGGPLALGAPAERARRLTGGWAFLIGAFLLGGYGAD